MSQKQAKRLRQAQRKATGSCELDRKREELRARREQLVDRRYEEQRALNRRLLERSKFFAELEDLRRRGVVLIGGGR